MHTYIHKYMHAYMYTHGYISACICIFFGSDEHILLHRLCAHQQLLFYILWDWSEFIYDSAVADQRTGTVAEVWHLWTIDEATVVAAATRPLAEHRCVGVGQILENQADWERPELGLGLRMARGPMPCWMRNGAESWGSLGFHNHEIDFKCFEMASGIPSLVVVRSSPVILKKQIKLYALMNSMLWGSLPVWTCLHIYKSLCRILN